MSRRRFLAGLGMIAGAGALAPLLSRAGIDREDTETVEVRRAGLGTWIRILARDPDRARASRAVQRAYAAVDRVDAEMSIHRGDTDLARVNRMAGANPVRVSEATATVTALALDTARRSNGVYDPTVLPLMRLYGYYRSGASAMPSEREIARTLEAVGHRHVAFDAARRTIALDRRGAGLDFGSIGKGWAVDRAVEALRAEGIRSGLVDIGGNVYGLGAPDANSRGWSVGVLHPVTHAVDRVFVLRDQAVATSGNSEQFRILSGIRIGHLFDARRGRPADGHLCATVLARSGVQADHNSTAAFLLGPRAFQNWPDVECVHFIG